ncbi:MAG: type II toxin-antitoxin system RelE/ParE family toxin [Bacteroidetes bacterium]|nr:type II toxin-antitoxin system RelE/ParE family toxin [Bacteroidota bacterium]MBL7102997.1 type II toxin-antitoxin system RelE/ParE family toxin [Bacteroidales bacterium]
MNIIWTHSARDELKFIYEYYRDIVSPKVARKIKDNIIKRIEILNNFPYAGQEEETLKVLKENHRYLVESNYKIIYKVTKNIVYITDVFDTRRDPQDIIEKHRI